MNFNKKLSLKIVIPLLALCIAVSSVGAVLLYSITRPASWTVTTDNGIELYSDLACTTVATEIAWGDVVRDSSNSVTYYLKNIGNTEDTWSYSIDAVPTGFTITLVDNTEQLGALAPDTQSTNVLNMNDVLELEITLDVEQDVLADTYGCNFDFNLGFNTGDEPDTFSFGTSDIVYESDCADFMTVTSDLFDLAEYELGESVNWQYTLQNIHATNDIDSVSYVVNLYDGVTFIEELDIGTWDIEPNLAPTESDTFSMSTFSAPLTLPTTEYKLQLRLTGHNSEGEYLYSTTIINNVPSYDVAIWSPSISGFTEPNSASSATYSIHNSIGENLLSVDIDIIIENATNHVVQTVESRTIDFVSEFGSALAPSGTQPFTVPFNSPNEWGNYEVKFILDNAVFETTTFAYDVAWQFENFDGAFSSDNLVSREITVTGMTAPSESSSVEFEFYNNHLSGFNFDYTIEIFNGVSLVQTIASNVYDIITGQSVYTSSNYAFTSPSSLGTDYHIIVTIDCKS